MVLNLYTTNLSEVRSFNPLSLLSPFSILCHMSAIIRRFVCFQPAIAVGNVAQLAVDLIVSTLSMKRVGYMHTDCLVPMVGPNPYATSAEDAGEIHTTAEGICHNFFYRSRSVLNVESTHKLLS